MRGRRRVISLAGVALLLAVGGLLFYANRAKEPTYHGKTAADWFQVFQKAERSSVYRQVAEGEMLIKMQMMGITNPPNIVLDAERLPHAEAVDALRALGTNAALYLADEIVRGDSRWSLWYGDAFRKSAGAVKRVLPNPPRPRSRAQSQAALALVSIGTAARAAIPVLIRGLVDPNPECLRNCIQALQGLQPASSDLNAVLLDLGHLGRFPQAMEIIEGLSVITPTSLQILGDALADSSVETRKEAARDLQHFGSAGASKLCPALADSDLAVRREAVNSLEALGPYAAEAVPGLAKVLGSEDRELRYLSARVLGMVGSNAVAAVPALIQATNDSDARVRRVAASALEKIGQ